MTSPRRVALVVAFVTMLLAACSSGASRHAPEELPGATGPVFGSGEIPEGFPRELPIPGGSTIGATLSDPGRGTMEMNVATPLTAAGVVEFYERTLPPGGFVVERSEAAGAEHVIGFHRAGLEGEIVIRPLRGLGVATIAISLE